MFPSCFWDLEECLIFVIAHSIPEVSSFMWPPYVTFADVLASHFVQTYCSNRHNNWGYPFSAYICGFCNRPKVHSLVEWSGHQLHCICQGTCWKRWGCGWVDRCIGFVSASAASPMLPIVSSSPSSLLSSSSSASATSVASASTCSSSCIYRYSSLRVRLLPLVVVTVKIIWWWWA